MNFIQGFWLTLTILFILTSIFLGATNHIIVSIICGVIAVISFFIFLNTITSSVDDTWFNNFYVRSMGVVISNKVGCDREFVTVVAYTFFNIPLYLNNYTETKRSSLFKQIECKESYLTDIFDDVNHAKKFIERNKYYFKPEKDIIFVNHNVFEHERIH